MTKLAAKWRGSFDPVLGYASGLHGAQSALICGRQSTVAQGSSKWAVCAPTMHEDFPRGEVIQSFKGTSYL